MPLDTLPCEFLFEITALTGVKAPVFINNGPNGTRLIVTASGGTFEGPKMRGVVADVAGGDWVTARADGSIRLDVRLLLQTDDGAHIFMAYSGIGIRGGGAMSLRTAPQFETGDERYAWLNSVQAVAHGLSGDGSVTYQVYALS